MNDNFYVGDRFRTNPLSLVPGGYDVKLYYSDKKPLVYNKVKDPEKYFKTCCVRDSTVVDYEIIGESKI
jgi:hypothetical protein